MIPCSFDYLIYPYYPAYTMAVIKLLSVLNNGFWSYSLLWLAVIFKHRRIEKTMDSYGISARC